jgi:hypothetical protein
MVFESAGRARGGDAPPSPAGRPQRWVATTEQGERRVLEEVA